MFSIMRCFAFTQNSGLSHFSEHKSFQDRLTHILYHLREEQENISGILSGECGEILMRYLKEYLYHSIQGLLRMGK